MSEVNELSQAALRHAEGDPFVAVGLLQVFRAKPELLAKDVRQDFYMLTLKAFHREND